MYIQVKIGALSNMPPHLSDLNLSGTGSCASFNFRRAARAVTSLYDRAFEPFSIRSTQFSILVGIAKTQPTSISALADLLVIDGTTLTRSLSLLKKQGLLSISDRSTRRQRFLTLTPKGERTLAASLPAWRKVQDRFVQTLGADYWTNFRNELEKLAHVALSLEDSPAEPEPAAIATH
jgi:DNA-binding MarR family transcriptional regulator